MIKFPEARYNVTITLSVPDAKILEDTKLDEFLVYRVPFTKMGSFAAGIVSMKYFEEYQMLEYYIQQNIFPIVILKVSFTTAEDPSKNTKTIINKVYNLIKCTEINPSTSHEERRTNIRMVFANPILYDLNMVNGFNTILSNLTAYEALLKYEEYLLSNRGPSSFEFIKVGEDQNLNKYKYEQLSIRQKNDLLVPNFLLYEKKAFNSFGYYFFDDFRISGKKKSDISGLFINLFNKDQFKTVDIYDSSIYPDSAKAPFICKKEHFNDPLSVFNKQSASSAVSITDKNGFNKKIKPKKVATQQSNNISIQSNIGDGRGDYSATTSYLEEKEKPNASIINLFSPDNIENTSNRFELLSEQFIDKFRSINEYELDDCYPDLYQFDRIYNLDDRSAFDNIPISIVNIFRKDGHHPETMYHSIKFKTIKFG
jgi:hypothetical protein